jgi:hypothetical protein
MYAAVLRLFSYEAMMIAFAKLKYFRNLSLCALSVLSFVFFFASKALAGPHVHGQGELNIAMEGDSLYIQISMPAGDVVGFEHAAKSEDEKRAQNSAKQQLENLDALLVLTGGSCELSEQSVNMAGVNSSNSELNSLDSLGGESEGHTHSHGHEHGHKHEHEHRNIVAEYQFNCQALNQLQAMDLNLFDVFPAVNILNAQWVGQKGQGSESLSSEARRISF